MPNEIEREMGKKKERKRDGEGQDGGGGGREGGQAKQIN